VFELTTLNGKKQPMTFSRIVQDKNSFCNIEGDLQICKTPFESSCDISGRNGMSSARNTLLYPGLA
jgi:hypothetical protein